MPDKLGIQTIAEVVVEGLDIVHNVRDSLPKIGWDDVGRIYAILKGGKALLVTDWRQAIAEARDLEPAENQMLGEIVDAKLREQEIVVQNITALIERSLTALDAILDVVELLPKKSAGAENDSTKDNEPV